METQRINEFGRRKSDRKRGAQYELLKVIAEHCKERILEYDVEDDCAILYEVKNGQFIARLICDQYVKNIDDYLILYEEKDREEVKQAFFKCLESPSHCSIDIRCNLTGAMEWYRFFLVSIADETGAVCNIAGRFVSIHDEKLVNETIRRKAEIDALTGVYNHIVFETLCEERLAELEGEVLFLMMDVDDFKMINDSLGHNVGDMVLSQTGQVLNETIGTHGMAGRLGGDEFAALIWGFSNRAAIVEFCDNLRMNLKNIIFDMEYSASMGVGIRAGRKMTFKDLYYEADQAVYVAKKNGKNQIVYYDEVVDAEESEEDSIGANDDLIHKSSEVLTEQLLSSKDRAYYNGCLEYILILDEACENILFVNQKIKDLSNGNEDAWKELKIGDLLEGCPIDYKKKENLQESYFVSYGAKRSEESFRKLFADADYLLHIIPLERGGIILKQVVFMDLSDGKQLNNVLLKRQENQKEIAKCMEHILEEDFSAGFRESLKLLCDYYDADCATVVYYNDGQYNKAKEYHRKSAEVMAKILLNVTEEGKMKEFQPLMSADGSLFLRKVTKIKETYPKIYTQLVDCRIWSLSGMYLKRQEQWAGALLLLNPRHNIGDDTVMRAVGAKLTTEILSSKAIINKE